MTQQQFILNVEDCQRALRRFLTALCCGDTELADDLAQETFIKAFLSQETLKDLNKFRAWIFRIAYNTFVSNHRCSRSSEPIEQAEKIANDENTDKSFEYQELYTALAKLSEKERCAILLYYMQGYNVKEIAEINETTADAVKQLLSRGRLHLKKYLTESRDSNNS